MSQDKNIRDDFDKTTVLPTTREEFLEEWRSDPKAVLDRAEEADLSLQGYADVRAPASKESPGSTLEYVLYNEGIRAVDTLHVPSTRANDLPKIYADETSGVEPLGHVVRAYWDQAYTKTLITGERAANLSNLTVGGGWRPRYDEGPVRSPNIAPGFNFTEVVALTRGIREDKYRVRRWTNAGGEKKMQKITEGTEPKIFEMTRATSEVGLDNYRAAVEWTDSFANDPQTRMADLTNAIEEIAIGHRIELLQDLGTLVRTSVPSGNVWAAASNAITGYTHAPGQLTYPYWTRFLKEFGNAYVPNVTLGSLDAIQNLELMSITGGNNISYGSWAMVPGSRFRSLNGDNTAMDWGYIEGNTAFTKNTSLYTFQREVTLAFAMRLGMDQDEVERDAGPRKTRRWLGAMSTFAVLDPNAIREIDYT